MIALVNGDYFAGNNLAAMMLLLCILCREFAVSGLRMVAATKGQVVEADTGGKVKTFVQLNAIGWLMGARMLSQDFGEVYGGQDRHWLTAVWLLGIILFILSAVLTVTSGITYFRRHGHVLRD
jgi:CDP-diacylglycerol--glycerol-3-phosphate 3-phosphatidyltransferase